MLYQKNKYDLIFLDIGLPGMSGLEICKSVRKKEDKIPIIALTANGELREQCINAGVNQFIQKPTNLQTLKNILIRWVSNYE